jgi:hypothetical protein
VAHRLENIASRTPVGVALRMPAAPLIAAALAAVWLLVDPRTPDLAAQVYRVDLFREQGFAVWDLRWYAGHALPGYSLLFPALALLLGMRAIAAIAVVLSALLGERLLRDAFGEGARWGAVWLAVAVVADIWIGRLTYALGVVFALASFLALMRGKAGLACLSALLCAAASPVAGVLLALAAVTHSLVHRSPRAALAIGAPTLSLVAILAVLFPEGGWEPYPTTSFLATVAIVLGFLWVLPSSRRELRLAGVLYLLACVACVSIHTPMGANIERYGLLLAGPILLCALGAARRERLSAQLHRGSLAAAVVVLGAIALWTVWGPVRETAAVAADASTSPAYYQPLKRFLAAHGGALVRVEVPFTRSHWEAAWLARSVSLARGWEKQLDTRYDDVLLRPGLSAQQYRHWLLQQAVAYVALPDVPLDPSSSQEGRLIRAGQPYLHEVFRSAHWRVYRVLGATPLLQGPGRLTALGHDTFALDAAAPGRFLMRVHYTRYWIATSGSACVTSAPGGWTAVNVHRAGAVHVAARFSLRRALGLDGSACRGEREETGVAG